MTIDEQLRDTLVYETSATAAQIEADVERMKAFDKEYEKQESKWGCIAGIGVPAIIVGVLLFITNQGVLSMSVDDCVVPVSQHRLRRDEDGVGQHDEDEEQDLRNTRRRTRDRRRGGAPRFGPDRHGHARADRPQARRARQRRGPCRAHGAVSRDDGAPEDVTGKGRSALRTVAY